MLRSLSLSVLFCASMAAQAPVAAERYGTICGTMLDENSRPAALTGVTLHDYRGHSGGYPFTRTDDAGRYCFSKVEPGEYFLSAVDEAKGYPDLLASFFAQKRTEAVITLTAEAPNGQVDYRIPYRAGFLHLSLTDAETGKSLPSMSVDLRVRSDPERRSMQLNALPDKVVLIPPNEEVYVTVSSPGYEVWPSDGSQGRVLNFLPGQTQTLQVVLHRKR